MFQEHGIDGMTLLDLTSVELAELGVRRLGHRKLLAKSIEHLRNKAASDVWVAL